MMGQRGFCVSVCVFSSQHRGSTVYEQPKGLGMNGTDVKECRVCSKVITKAKRDRRGFVVLHVCREGQALEYSWIVPCSPCTAFGEKEDGKEGRGGGFGKGAVSSQEQGVPAIPGTLTDVLKSSPVVHPSFSHCSRETWSKSGIPAVTPEL